MKNRKRNQQGFSLIELLIVVAIILIIAAIAIPNLLQARVAANEASAVASLRTITVAQVSYADNYPTVGFAPALANLGGTNCSAPDQNGACFIDSQLASGTKNGYNFTSIGIGIESQRPISVGRLAYRWQRKSQLLFHRKWHHFLRPERWRHCRS